MGKILAALLIVAAMGLAAYYLLSGRKLHREEVEAARGWRRHLLVAAAIILAMLGTYGCSSGKEAAFRRAWREADVFPHLVHRKKFEQQRNAKLAEHAKAVSALAGAGLIDADSAKILKQAFDMMTDSVRFRNGKITCYKPSIAGSARVRAEGELAKSAAELPALAESGKLAPAVVEKARALIARELQIISIANKHDDPVPPEFVKAADTLARLLTEQ